MAIHPDLDATVTAIAKGFLGLNTLKTQKSDALDFSEQAVWQIRGALRAAFEAGQAAASAGGK